MAAAATKKASATKEKFWLSTQKKILFFLKKLKKY
jgi:hypothetical protein